ncbi:hypothetical protein [Spiroplasma endosymbiont of Glossina fuscipes fuscipes]|uniref:hypothetical protein n=1 Tax=Spiroplasma endosymbiont of Glossina fuscipes fuscipes TaxID=2004463 RepID=UPI003C755170
MFNRLFGYNNEGFTSQQYQDVSIVQLTYYGDNQNKMGTDLSYYRVYLADNINLLGKTVEAIFQKASCKWSATNQLRKGLIFYWKETLFYFAVLSN